MTFYQTTRWIVVSVLFVAAASLGACSDDSTEDGESFCGNAVVEAGEDCDGTDLGGATCESLGLGVGSLSCRSTCRFDTSGCGIAAECGNAVVEAGEDCDGTDLGGATCESLGLGVGSLSCRSTCRFDTSGCGIAAECGNAVVEAGEECDDGQANSDSEPDACRTNCRNPTCGDGVVDSGEECDDGQANSDSEPDACRTNCRNPTCGDGVADSGEECDDGQANSDSEPDACRTNCRNPICGDGVADSGEECDDGGVDSGYDGCTALCTATEFQINTQTTSDQSLPSVAMAPDGRFVVAWTSNGQDGSSYGIFAQRYDAQGNTVGSEFQVNTHTQMSQVAPAAAMAADGRFVVAWTSDGQDGDGHGIFAQRYDAQGTVIGSEFQVNTHTTSEQWFPSVAMASDGRFLIAWQSDGQDGSNYGIFAQRYDAQGTVVGSEFQVNTYTHLEQSFAHAAMAADGRFVVVWQSNGQDGSDYGIFAQRYGADGNPVGSEFRVNTETSVWQVGPAVAMAADGRFIVAWGSERQDGDGYGVFAQRYDGNGDPVGSEFQVNTYTNSHQANPSVTIGTDGRFVIAWTSNGQDGSDYGIFAQRYDGNGDPVGSEFQVNTYVTLSQTQPQAAMASDGRFVIVWQSDGQDGDGNGLFGRLFSALGEPRGPGGW